MGLFPIARHAFDVTAGKSAGAAGLLGGVLHQAGVCGCTAGMSIVAFVVSYCCSLDHNCHRCLFICIVISTSSSLYAAASSSCSPLRVTTRISWDSFTGPSASAASGSFGEPPIMQVRRRERKREGRKVRAVADWDKTEGEIWSRLSAGEVEVEYQEYCKDPSGYGKRERQ
eukprot:750130-Hanusia_phi.AAC.3